MVWTGEEAINLDALEAGSYPDSKTDKRSVGE